MHFAPELTHILLLDARLRLLGCSQNQQSRRLSGMQLMCCSLKQLECSWILQHVRHSGLLLASWLPTPCSIVKV